MINELIWTKPGHQQCLVRCVSKSVLLVFCFLLVDKIGVSFTNTARSISCAIRRHSVIVLVSDYVLRSSCRCILKIIIVLLSVFCSFNPAFST